MLILVLCALAVASPLVVGRWPAALALYRWRWPVLVWLAFVLQFLVLILGLAQAAAPVLHVLTYVAAIAFLWLNRHLRGLLVVGAGALLNAVTIALNGGVLPARPQAVASAGLDHGDGFANSAVVADPVLPWLGDVFAWPAPMPLANTFSVGDMLIVLGVVIAAWSGTSRLGSRPAEVGR